MNTHPSMAELLAYPLGELRPERAHAVFEHCCACVECGDELAAIIVLRASVLSEEPVRWRNWYYLAVAASLILLLGVGFLSIRAMSNAGDGPPGPVADVAPAEPGYASLATRETLPQAHVNFRLGLAMPASVNQGMLRQGMQAIVDERFDDAERILQQLHAIRPDDTEVAVHLGVASYLRGDLSGETEALLGVEPPTGSLGRTGHWYLGNLLLARGEVQRARLVLESLVDANDRWGRRAQGLLQAIDRS